MEKVERLSRELAYTGTVIKVYRDHVRVPGGQEADWDYIHHDGAAAVVPVLPDGRILMVRQYRNALDRFTLELPAGKVDAPDEPKELCAARELEEETGFRAGSLEHLVDVHTAAAYTSEKIAVYVAKDLIPSRQHLDEDEFVDIRRYTFEELNDMIFSGKITDSKTIAAVMAYQTKQRK